MHSFPAADEKGSFFQDSPLKATQALETKRVEILLRAN